MRNTILAASLALVLPACTAQQISTTTDALNAACKSAQVSAADAQGALKGGALTTANSIAVYVAGACTAQGVVASLANDPATLAWLGQIKGQLDTLKATAPANAPAATAAVPAA